VAAGNSPSECAGLPSCYDEDELKKFYAASLPGQVDCVDIGITCLPTDPTKIAEAILNFGTGIGALLAVLFLIIGGFGVATSGGNPENLEKAKSQITAAIAGLVFILLTGLILRTIGGIIGIDIKLFGI